MNGLICMETSSIVRIVLLCVFFVAMMIIASVIKRRQGEDKVYRPAEPANVRRVMNSLVPTVLLLSCLLSIVIAILAFTNEYSMYLSGSSKAIAVAEVLVLIVAFASYYFARKKAVCYALSLVALFVAAVLSFYVPFFYGEASYYLVNILCAVIPIAALFVAVHYFATMKAENRTPPAELTRFLSAWGRVLLLLLSLVAVIAGLVNGILALTRLDVGMGAIMWGIVFPVFFLAIAVIAPYIKDKTGNNGNLGYRQNYLLSTLYATFVEVLVATFSYSFYHLLIVQYAVLFVAILLFISCYYLLPWKEKGRESSVFGTDSLLADLNSLYLSGIITKAEYEAEKEKLLLK